MVPLAAAILALGSAWVGAYFRLIGKERELDIRMVETSPSILKGENKGTETEQARRFALRALEHYSKIDIPKDEFEKWVATGTIEFGKVPENGWYTLGYVDTYSPFSIKGGNARTVPSTGDSGSSGTAGGNGLGGFPSGEGSNGQGPLQIPIRFKNPQKTRPDCSLDHC